MTEENVSVEGVSQLPIRALVSELEVEKENGRSSKGE